VAEQTEFDEDDIDRLRLAIGRSARALRLSTPDTGLTPTQSTVLFTIVRVGPIGVADLAAAENLNPTMLSRVIGLLADRGLVVRTPDPQDGRSALLEATPDGRALRERARRARAATLRVHLDHLDSEQLSTLHGALPILEALAQDLKGART